MKEFKGTKGIWSYKSNNYYYDIMNNCNYEEGSRKLAVSCMINVIGNASKNINVKDDSLCLENESNAKLIASAPELLKALQLMVSNFKQYQKESGAKNQAILKSEQAIKKALN